MTKSSIIAIILTLCIFQKNISQDYYIPYNLKQAYQNGSRNYNGTPGINYFQNYSDYRISVNFDPVKGILKGSEKITYFNNSSDSLYYIVIRLYQDILKKGNIRDDEIDPTFINDGVDITSLIIENVQYVDNESAYLSRTGSNLVVSLPRYLNPNDSISLKINWISKFPPGHVHRFGNYGPSDWFIAYWYPQISVYDDIDGWDEFNYTGSFEFYNDFNNYEVEIDVPSGHMAWATGNWENAGSILTEKVYGKYLKAGLSDKTIQIITSDDWNNQQVFRKRGRLSFKFSAKNISDFAFALSDSYVWDGASTVTDSTTNSRVSVFAVYPPDDTDFQKVAQIGAKSIHHFSYKSLGVAYPFPQVTVFNGEGGMEFPMMVNERSTDYRENQFVTMHEIFHGYFPFYTGNNERKYAWMDEGLTSYLPMETETYLGGSYFQLPFVCQYYSGLAGIDIEQPLMVPSVQTRNESYYHQAYYRSTVAYSVLEQYLGREKFRSFIRYFIDTWKGKHPTGYDFIFALNDFTGENLYWLVHPWFFEPGWADLAIEKAEIINNNLIVSIKNDGGFPVPIDLKIYTVDGQIIFKNYKADIWKGAGKDLKITIENVNGFKSVEIGNPNVPDKDQKNNRYPAGV
jgi:hypothetical protein